MVAGSWLERMGIPTQTFKSTSEMGINPYFANGLISDGLWRKAAKGYQMNPTDPSWPVGNWPLNPGDTWDTTGRPPPKTPPPTTPPPTTPTAGAVHEQQTGMSPEVQAATGKGPSVNEPPKPTEATKVFTPSTDWQDVPDWAAVPGEGGAHYQMDMKPDGTQKTQVRWENPPGPEKVTDRRTGKPQSIEPEKTEPAPPNAPPAQEAIARRAYEISQEREQKGTPGDHVSDWLQAENELRGGKAAPKAGPEAPAPETPASNTDEYHAQLEELRKRGVPAGEAQAIVEGRQPKTLEQEQSPPQMPGRRGAKGPIVSSPKPVWQPGLESLAQPLTLLARQRLSAHSARHQPRQAPNPT
jgi:hypothetical protein